MVRAQNVSKTEQLLCPSLPLVGNNDFFRGFVVLFI